MIPNCKTPIAGNVLSNKVDRALHVRTDTPAMRAALDALANLSVGEFEVGRSVGSGVVDSGANASNSAVDARSVRAAIERDALLQALQFQVELCRLAEDATSLRERIDAVARVAQCVGTRVESPLVVLPGYTGSPLCTDTNNGQVSLGDSAGTVFVVCGDGSEDRSSCHTTAHTSEVAWDEERTLAARLQATHKHLVEATRRQVVVEEFLDKFDLEEKEAHLLDHYNFEGFMEGTLGDDTIKSPWSHEEATYKVHQQPSSSALKDATAFLDALERLVIIRSELSKTFGGISATLNANISEPNESDFSDDIRSGGHLGTHSALRMMEQLASRQERAHERLYQFIQHFLGIGHAAVSAQTHQIPTCSADMGRSSSASDVTVYGGLGRFRDCDEMDEAFCNLIVRRSLHVLRHSPSRRCHALELIASSRRAEVTRRFLLALTSGFDGALPIEMRAHDSVAYVGDMLAFSFRAFRVEEELAKTLLMWNNGGVLNHGKNLVNEFTDGPKAKINYGPDPTAEAKELSFDENESGERPMTPSDILAQSMGGLARPLRSRIAQVLSSLTSQRERPGIKTGEDVGRHFANLDETDAGDDETSSLLNRLVATFSICGLLRFYYSAVYKTLSKLQQHDMARKDTSLDIRGENSRNAFLATCNECLVEASACYVALLRAYSSMIGTHKGSPETEAYLTQRVIVRISEERATSPGFADDVLLIGPASNLDTSSKQLSLSFLVSTMLNVAMPYVKSLDDGLALKLALSSAYKLGLEASSYEEWIQVIEEKEKSLTESLINSEAEKVLVNCGLGRLYTALKHMNGVYVEGMTIVSHPGLSQKDVEESMEQFYSSLSSPPLPTFENFIKDPTLRKHVRSKIAQKVVDVYQALYEAITSEKGGYDDLAFLGHSPAQVKNLLML